MVRHESNSLSIYDTGVDRLWSALGSMLSSSRSVDGVEDFISLWLGLVSLALFPDAHRITAYYSLSGGCIDHIMHVLQPLDAASTVRIHNTATGSPTHDHARAPPQTPR